MRYAPSMATHSFSGCARRVSAFQAMHMGVLASDVTIRAGSESGAACLPEPLSSSSGPSARPSAQHCSTTRPTCSSPPSRSAAQLGALGSIPAAGGAVVYAPLSRGVSRKRLIYVSISALAWERVAPLIPHVRDSAPRRAPYSSDLSPGIGPD
jgi:hypothetical protein